MHGAHLDYIGTYLKASWSANNFICNFNSSLPCNVTHPHVLVIRTWTLLRECFFGCCCLIPRDTNLRRASITHKLTIGFILHGSSKVPWGLKWFPSSFVDCTWASSFWRHCWNYHYAGNNMAGKKKKEGHTYVSAYKGRSLCSLHNLGLRCPSWFNKHFEFPQTMSSAL